MRRLIQEQGTGGQGAGVRVAFRQVHGEHGVTHFVLPHGLFQVFQGDGGGAAQVSVAAVPEEQRYRVISAGYHQTPGGGTVRPGGAAELRQNGQGQGREKIKIDGGIFKRFQKVRLFGRGEGAGGAQHLPQESAKGFISADDGGDAAVPAVRPGHRDPHGDGKGDVFNGHSGVGRLGIAGENGEDALLGQGV